MRKTVAYILGLAVCLGAAFDASSAPAEMPASLVGHFVTTPGGPTIAIAECGVDKFCGRIVTLGKLPATDTRNPNAADRARGLCGLTVLALTKSRSTRPERPLWEGELYDAEKGTRYEVVAELRQDKTLGMRGRTVPIVTRSFPFTQHWERTLVPQVACTAPSS